MKTPPDQLRASLLRYLSAPGVVSRGLGADLLRAIAAQEGAHADADEIAAELTYLQDKGFVTLNRNELAPTISRWRITAAGRDALAELTA